MNKSYIFIGLLGIFICILVIASFLEVGSPLSKRALAFDQKRMSNFSTASYEIEYYYEDNNKLPDKLSDLKREGTEFILDPETNKPYDYKKVSETSYELCTKFSTDSKEVNAKKKKSNYYEDYDYGVKKDHKKGYDCIKYEIDKYLVGDNYPDYSYDEPSPALTPGPTSIKVLSPNSKWSSEDFDADITLTNAYLSEVKVINGDYMVGKNSLLVEYTVLNKSKATTFYGGDFGEVSIENKTNSISSESSEYISENKTGKVYALFLIDKSTSNINMLVGDYENYTTVNLDFSKSSTVSGYLDLDKGFVEKR